MNAAKTTNERVAKLRADRDALGLKRKEVYVHDDDWPELLKLAKRLERRRSKTAGKWCRLTLPVSEARQPSRATT